MHTPAAVLPVAPPTQCLQVYTILPYPTQQEYLGLEKIIWLWKGVAGDDSVVNGGWRSYPCLACLL